MLNYIYPKAPLVQRGGDYSDLHLLNVAAVMISPIYTGISQNTTIIVRDGLIAAAAGAEGEVLDCTGLTIYPGSIDVHNHGAVGVDVNEATVDGLLMIAELRPTRSKKQRGQNMMNLLNVGHHICFTNE